MSNAPNDDDAFTDEDLADVRRWAEQEGRDPDLMVALALGADPFTAIEAVASTRMSRDDEVGTVVIPNAEDFKAEVYDLIRRAGQVIVDALPAGPTSCSTCEGSRSVETGVEHYGLFETQPCPDCYGPAEADARALYDAGFLVDPVVDEEQAADAADRIARAEADITLLRGELDRLTEAALRLRTERDEAQARSAELAERLARIAESAGIAGLHANPDPSWFDDIADIARIARGAS